MELDPPKLEEPHPPCFNISLVFHPPSLLKKKIPSAIASCQTIEGLRNEIESLCSVSPLKQKLVYYVTPKPSLDAVLNTRAIQLERVFPSCGELYTVLENDLKFHEVHVHALERIGSQKINVKMITGSMLSIQCTPEDHIKDLKEICLDSMKSAYASSSFPTPTIEQIRLMHYGKDMENGTLCSDYNFTTSTCLQMILNYSPKSASTSPATTPPSSIPSSPVLKNLKEKKTSPVRVDFPIEASCR